MPPDKYESALSWLDQSLRDLYPVHSKNLKISWKDSWDAVKLFFGSTDEQWQMLEQIFQSSNIDIDFLRSENMAGINLVFYNFPSINPHGPGFEQITQAFCLVNYPYTLDGEFYHRHAEFRVDGKQLGSIIIPLPECASLWRK